MKRSYRPQSAALGFVSPARFIYFSRERNRIRCWPLEIFSGRYSPRDGKERIRDETHARTLRARRLERTRELEFVKPRGGGGGACLFLTDRETAGCSRLDIFDEHYSSWDEEILTCAL